MAKMIQIRNVPDELHARLKARAALSGKSLSEYLLGIVEQAADRLTPEELRARIAERERIPGSVGAAEVIREMRGTLP